MTKSTKKRYSAPKKYTSTVYTYLEEPEGKAIREEAKRRGVAIASLVRDLILPGLREIQGKTP